MSFRLALLTTIFSMVLFSSQVLATHLRSGQIRIEQTAVGSATYKITVQVYTNTRNTGVLFGGDQDYLDFGDGSPLHLVPEQDNIMIDWDYGIAMAQYSIEHTYPGSGEYVVSYHEPNRNVGILNFENSGETSFYLESSFLYDPFFLKLYRSPEFLAPQIFRGNDISGFSFSLAAKEVSDYRLIYKVDVPKSARALAVTNYQLPGNFEVNEFNGLVTWDGEFNGMHPVGEFLFSVKVYQFQDDYIMGYTVRDIQVVMEEADFSLETNISDDKELDANDRIFINQDESSSIEILADGSRTPLWPFFVTLNVYSELGPENFSFVSSREGNVTKGILTLTSTSEIVRDNPYIITVRATYGPDDEAYTKDVNYLFYTKDIEPQEPIILSSERDVTLNTMYPNPVRDFLQVDVPNAKNFTVTVLNQQGMRVQQHSIAVDNSVDLRALPSGFYICEVRHGSKLILRKKIFKEL